MKTLKQILHETATKQGYSDVITEEGIIQSVKEWLQQKLEEHRKKGNLFYCKVLNELLED